MSGRHTIKSLNKNEIYSSVFKSDSISIKYWKGGHGPTLVFIHGFGGDGTVTWEKELKHFVETNTIITYDLLWFGDSYSNEPANLSTQTSALEKLLAHLQIDSATLIGQSYGGFVALDFAYKFPDKVERLVIANSPGPTFDISYLDTVCKNFELNTISDLFVLEDPNNIQRLMNAATYSDKHIPKFLRRQMFDAYFHKNNAEQIALMTSLPAEQSKMQDLSTFKKIPTLVLWGENDEIFPLKEGQKFATAIDAKFVSIPKCGHGPQVDQHKAFLKILNDFIQPQL
jgi:pimeloyl-ACP methyl ester carboxylesterase